MSMPQPWVGNLRPRWTTPDDHSQTQVGTVRLMPGAPGAKPSPAFSEYFCRRQLNSSAIVTLITRGNYCQLTLGFACTPAAACCKGKGSVGLVVPTGTQEQHCRLVGA